MEMILFETIELHRTGLQNYLYWSNSKTVIIIISEKLIANSEMVRLFVLYVIFMVMALVFGIICTPEYREGKEPNECRHKELRQGCVCYTNGSCIHRLTNICFECTNPDVTSVTYEPC